MSFWSAVVKPGKPHAYVPPPEEWNLHLSQASLDVTVPEGRRVSLLVRLSGGDEDGGKSEQPVVLCTLTAGRTDNMPLDLFFSQYAEFTVKVGGKGSGSGKDDDIEVHLSGYYTPAMGVDGEEGGEDEDEDEDEDEEYQLPDGEDEDSEDMEIPGGLERLPKHLQALLAANAARRGLPGPEGDEEDDDEEGEEDEDEDEEDEDEDEDMDGDEDEEMFGFEPAVGRRKPHVVIEEVVDDEDDKKKKQQQQQDKKAEAKGKKEEKKEQQQQPQQQQQEKGKKENKQQQQQQQQANGDQGKAGKRQAEAPAKKDETPAKKQAAGQDQPQAKPVKQQQQQQQQEGKATPAKKNIRTFENGFQIEEVSYGNPKGKLAKAGQRVSVRYVGRLKSNGKVFDKSDKKPFTFRLGVGEVIKGWDAGVEGMKVGDKRRLVIPPQMAYGSGGVRGTIPPNATLEFDVELVDVK